MKRLYLILLSPLLVLALAWWAIKFVWCVIVKPEEAWRLAVSADQLANATFAVWGDRYINKSCV